MNPIDYVVRDSGGAVDRGSISGGRMRAKLRVSEAQEISFNLTPGDLAGYERDGDDLVILLVDGRSIVIDNYFNDSGIANRLFLSSEGSLNEVSFVETADGALYGQYGPTQEWGKWSASDDLIFLGHTEIAGSGAYDQVSMFAPAALGLPGAVGAGVVGVAGVAGVSAGDSDPTPAPKPVAPWVDKADTTTDVGGDGSGSSVDVTGGGQPGDTVTVTLGDSVLTTEIGRDGTFGVVFVGEDFPGDGSHEAVVVVTSPDGNVTELDGPAFIIDTETFVSIETDTVEGDGIVNSEEHSDGVTVTGTSETGARVDVTWGDTTQTVTTNDKGDWAATFDADDIPEGSYTETVTAVATDSFGNTSDAAGAIEVDTEVVPFTLDPVASAQDGFVNAEDAAMGIVVTGTAEQDAIVDVAFGDAVLTTSPAADGIWSVTFTPDQIPQGEYIGTITAVATDPAGNNAVLTQDVSIDTVPNGISLARPIEGDDIINEVETTDGVILSGRSEAGAVVLVSLGDASHTAVTGEDGTWQAFFAKSEVPDGTYQARIMALSTDDAGNRSTLEDSVLVDTQVDNFVIAADESAAGTVVSGDTFAEGILVSGTVEEGASVDLNLDGVQIAADVDADGNWSATLPTDDVARGEYDAQIAVTATDVAGNVAELTEDIRIDTEVSHLSLIPNYINDVLSSDGVISAAEIAVGVRIGGRVEPGSTVEVTFLDSTVTADVDTYGSWIATIPTEAFVPGSYDADISVLATDPAGNTAELSQTVAVDAGPADDVAADTGLQVPDGTSLVIAAGANTASTFMALEDDVLGTAQAAQHAQGYTETPLIADTDLRPEDPPVI